MKSAKLDDRKLRHQAEERLHQTAPADFRPTVSEPERLIHELQVHQIELEMQNEELRTILANLEELQQSNALFKLLATSFPDHFMVQDRDLRYTMVINPQLDLTENDMLGKTDHDFLPKNDADKLTGIKRRVLETGEAMKLEIPVTSAQGEQGYFDGSFVPVFDASGAVDGLIGYFKNVTARKQAEETLRQSLNFSQNILETTPNLIYIYDLQEKRNVYTNPGLTKVLGYLPEEVREYDKALFAIMLHPDDVARVDEHHGRLAAADDDEVIELEYRMKHASGEWITLRSRDKVFLRDEQGKVKQILGTAEDITERKRTEESLRDREAQFAAFMSYLPAAAFVKDESGRVQFANQYLQHLMDFRDWENRTTPELVNGKIGQRMAEDDRLALEQGPLKIEETITDSLGEVRTFKTIKFPIAVEGKPVLLGGISVEITDRKRIEEVLIFLAQTGSGTSSEPFFHALARYLALSLGMGFVCIDRLEGDGLHARTLAVWNDGHFEDNVAYALKDTPCGEVVEKSFCCFPAGVCRLFPHDRLLQDLGAESYVGVTLFSHAGQPIGLIAVIGRRPLSSVQTAESILKLVAVRAAAELERLDAEESLRQSEEKFRSIVESSPTAMYFYRLENDSRLVLIGANPATDRIIGISHRNLLGKTIEEAFPRLVDTEIPQMYRDIALGKTGRQEFEIAYQDEQGIDGYYAVSVFRTGERTIAVDFVDISERKEAEKERDRLEKQLVQSQKMEAVGRLAGGVAHDFNNMLGVILGHAELALMDMGPGEPLFDGLQEIRKAAERSADLTRQLLAFARKQSVSPRVLDVNETVEGMLKMLRRLIGEDIELVWLPDEGLLPLKIDPSQIDQILANLCVNARHAIAGTGRIVIETENVSMDDGYCAAHPGFVPGDYVALFVSDTGCGMDKEVLPSIFEPFFTTKGLGEGTGLGLATVYGIVKQNNGFIEVSSEPGRGTTFSIFFSPYTGNGKQQQAEGPMGTVSRGYETVLLVEDEPTLLTMSKTMLESLGYRVMATSRAEQAVELLEQHGNAIQLLITDVIMPGMNGRELANRLQTVNPGLKCLFMSGYTANVITDQAVSAKDVNFIMKPFSMKALAEQVRIALE